MNAHHRNWLVEQLKEHWGSVEPLGRIYADFLLYFPFWPDEGTLKFDLLGYLLIEEGLEWPREGQAPEELVQEIASSLQIPLEAAWMLHPDTLLEEWGEEFLELPWDVQMFRCMDRLERALSL